MSKTDISQNNTTKRRSQNTDGEPNKKMVEFVSAEVTKTEYDYLKAMASLLSKFKMNGTPFIKDGSISELIRGCLGSTCNMYQYNVFPDSKIVEMLPDREAIKEFIAFRKKYMNFPIDAQLEDLKRLGIVKAKQQQETATQ